MKKANSSNAAWRGLLLALVAFGLTGTAVELLLLQHYEDSWQLVPLFFIAMSLLVVSAHALLGRAETVHLLRVTMCFLIVVGVIGIVLHYKGNLEFQLEIDPTQSRWELFKKVIRAKAPPALAPGVMAQLGLLGLLCTYRHPALERRETS